MNKLIEFLKNLFKKKPVETPVGPTSESQTASKPIEKPQADKLLWYPEAVIPKNKMNGSGTYQYGYPQGAIVHFTAGQDTKLTDAMDSYEWGRGEGFVFFIIGIDGTVIQGFPLNVRGSHAGTSHWPSLGDNVSKYLVGIEICCAGKVEKLSDDEYISWFKRKYKKSEVRYVTEENYGCPTGYYKKFTEAQEKALVELLTWLKNNNPDVFNVDYILAHHEVAGKKGIGHYRKEDCGGSLSITMDQLRSLVRSKIR